MRPTNLAGSRQYVVVREALCGGAQAIATGTRR